MLLSRGKTENIMENEDKNQEIASKTPVNEVPAATRNIKIEALLIAAAIAIGVLVAVIVSHQREGDPHHLSYQWLCRQHRRLDRSLFH